MNKKIISLSLLLCMVGSNVASASTTTDQLTKINVEQNQNTNKLDKGILKQENSTERMD